MKKLFSLKDLNSDDLLGLFIVFGIPILGFLAVFIAAGKPLLFFLFIAETALLLTAIFGGIYLFFKIIRNIRKKYNSPTPTAKTSTGNSRPST
ncbi:hypothetical protein [Desulfatibacillum aliphaticivorans]|uniref:hypothetical protein n=1 Tax=Desulfatibacillum aliphaticivorans TaxID=218208 RepID=UPI00047F82D1|nr:hypothetical protein [Desulfatibacillum aliphaticivorans]